MKPDGTHQSFASALKNAFAGFAFGARHERNVKIDCTLAVVAVVLGFVFALSFEQWLAVVICIGMVISLELVNTSIEALTDLVSPDFHPLAGRAKDCAAGACFVASCCALAVGLIVFIPHIMNAFL